MTTEIVSIECPEDVDIPIIKIVDILRPHKMQVSRIDLEAYALGKCSELIREYGITKLHSIQVIQEAMIKKDIQIPQILTTVLEYLENVKPVNELIIVDGYLFSKNKQNPPNYSNLILSVLESTVKKIKEIVFVTGNHDNCYFFNEIETGLKKINNSLKVTIKKTSDIHDRFWISDRSKGFFLGTSFNTIGNKYALIDNIDTQDVQEILDILKRLSLIEPSDSYSSSA